MSNSNLWRLQTYIISNAVQISRILCLNSTLQTAYHKSVVVIVLFLFRWIYENEINRIICCIGGWKGDVDISINYEGQQCNKSQLVC